MLGAEWRRATSAAPPEAARPAARSFAPPWPWPSRPRIRREHPARQRRSRALRVQKRAAACHTEAAGLRLLPGPDRERGPERQGCRVPGTALRRRPRSGPDGVSPVPIGLRSSCWSKPRLSANAFQCLRVEVVARVSGHRDSPLLHGMYELPMAPRVRHQAPPVRIELPKDVADLHRIRTGWVIATEASSGIRAFDSRQCNARATGPPQSARPRGSLQTSTSMFLRCR